MDIESLLRESRAEKLLEPLGLTTETGKQQFQKQIRMMSSTIGILQRRQESILLFRETLNESREEELDTLFREIRDVEPSLELFFKKTDVEQNSYDQLLFSSWKSLQVLNTVPFLLLALSIFKQYIVPALALFTPIFMIFMPYIFLKYVYNVPITTQQYTHILMGMFGLQNFEMKNPKAILQGSLTVFSIGQSIYQPIQNALHLQTIHADLMKKAEAAQKIVFYTDALLKRMPSQQRWRNPLQDVETQDIHRLFASFWDNPHILRLALQVIGDCEVVYRLAKAKEFRAVEYLVGQKPYLHILDGKDPFQKNSIPFTFKLSGQRHHAILTGPNRGGKSSVLRSTLLMVLLSQTFGVAPASTVQLRPFDWIATGLRLEDRPGSISMFESEVEFAIQILQRAKYQSDKIGFVVFDELFHSTNPPDGARTADIFLQKLWQTSNIASFISTHVFALARKSHRTIQKLCVPAKKQEDGSLHFTYTLQKGICSVSSVDEILKEKGLLSA